MVEINASTKISVKKTAPPPKAATGKPSAAVGGHRGSAPPLKPSALASPDAVASLLAKSKEEQKTFVFDHFQKALGEESIVKSISTPHAASTTKDRAGAAADVAVAAKELGVAFVLKECQITEKMQLALFPEGIDKLFVNHVSDPVEGGLRPSMSALSLASMETEATTAGSLGTDSKRGKSTPANAREGSLLVIRALCEIVGKPAEPFVVGAFLAASLDECGSASSSVRQAAEDATSAIISMAHPWAFPAVICPLLLQSLKSTEWRVKTTALERLEQCAMVNASYQVYKLIPKLIPALTDQVFDTKPQVAKATKSTLLAVCNTNTNQDIKNAIPAIVNAICKPADTNKAVSELMGTTFVVPVDASTLALLCPVLARALKEKLAIHKRQACLVISNMSKLVISPESIAPFGSLLVPELKKVATNVQFEEIRDEALKALANLTKALGDSYALAAQTQTDGDRTVTTNTTTSTSESAQQAEIMESEQARVEAEQKRIEAERLEAQRKEEEQAKKEEEERKRFKEAMDAQRELDLIAAREAAEKKKEEEIQREKQRLSTKSSTGTCQGCGLKKCKKTCMFYSGK
ncbi:hypothetical protein FisN_5Hh407 [Fistulifera solaris]|jgi:hypothetical protein|uniref:TOG domain-containing protein n=1 Tax=Fistulifera solaris TaxID=1519565 RepID=A0A1Z5JSL4_FISSO|nr:hypothetical protein FisN_5Hh407 [Fistulifera solaris]|eukprot:GAX17023.1 hypothetical protein FisN_5Hh407 [Fistulifera solaris]